MTRLEYSEGGEFDTTIGVDLGQTFRMGFLSENRDWDLNSVKLVLKRIGDLDNPNLTINLYAVGINGLPTGDSLSTGSIAGSSVPEENTLMNIPMSAFVLRKNNSYAIIISEDVGISLQNTGIGTYDGGILLARFGGGWATTNSDANFEIHGSLKLNTFVHGGKHAKSKIGKALGPRKNILRALQ